ncbi:MAG: 30S ribosomal protein S2, partial [Pseudomonadota bacterium]
MQFPTITMRQMLEAGVHFGHTKRRWNPKMKPYIFGVHNNVCILDLSLSLPCMRRALSAVYEVAAGGGRVLFVATKRQAQEPVKQAAIASGQYYVNHRWLGGMMTNWKTITASIKQLKSLDEQLAAEQTGLTKKERLELERRRDKLELVLGGIREMGGLPDILVVIDTVKEAIAVREANECAIPVIGIIDTNASPEGIEYPIPGNDDALRAIKLYTNNFAAAILAGIERSLSSSGGYKSSPAGSD